LIVPTPPLLRLLREAPLGDLLPAARHGRWEASGVLAYDGRLHVVFDNVRAVAVLTDELAPTLEVVGLPSGRGQGYEDLARDPLTGHFYLLIESLRRKLGWMARVEEYDDRFRLVSHGWLDFDLPSSNKGLEGLTCVQRLGHTYVLGLCEGNWCAQGKRGRTPGGGRIQVFERRDGAWPHVASLHLPASLPFRDFSALAAAGDRVAVVSQESSAMWLGRLAPDTWEVQDDGAVYDFPRDRGGDVVYCNAEGVSWINDDRLVMVSDRAKPGEQHRRCRAKEESIHVFTLTQPAQPPAP
jgi:hypothetical protein